MTECYKWWLPKSFLWFHLPPFISVFSVLLSSSELLGLAVLEAPAEVTAQEPVCGSPWQQSRPGEGVEEDVLWWCLTLIGLVFGVGVTEQLGGWQWEEMAQGEFWDTAVPPAAALAEPAPHSAWELLCLQSNFQLFVLWREMEPGPCPPAEPCALMGCGACLSVPLEPPGRSSSASSLG